MMGGAGVDGWIWLGVLGFIVACALLSFAWTPPWLRGDDKGEDDGPA